jgi:hypothetical protein
MRAKLIALTALVLSIAAGAAWAYSTTSQPAPEPTEAGCCVTGDCCCPGQGACCDHEKRAAPDVANSLVKSESCCQTGNCCCPGAGSCCPASPADEFVCPVTGEKLACERCCPLNQK